MRGGFTDSTLPIVLRQIILLIIYCLASLWIIHQCRIARVVLCEFTFCNGCSLFGCADSLVLFKYWRHFKRILLLIINGYRRSRALGIVLIQKIIEIKPGAHHRVLFDRTSSLFEVFIRHSFVHIDRRGTLFWRGGTELSDARWAWPLIVYFNCLFRDLIIWQELKSVVTARTAAILGWLDVFNSHFFYIDKYCFNKFCTIRFTLDHRALGLRRNNILPRARHGV